MKKTSFTLKEHTYVSTDGPCKIPGWLMFCLAFAFSFGLFVNQGYAQTFGVMSDCPALSGNAINSGCPVAPAPVNAGPTCMVPVPTLMPVGGFTMADVTVGAGYSFIAGAIQEPMPGSMVGTGSTDIYVGALFTHPVDGICAVACPPVALVVTDVTPPVNNCMASLLVDVDAAGPCTITIDEAYLRANMFNVDPSDNCTALDDLVITASVGLVGPLVCPAPNPQSFPFIITVTDAAGIPTTCAAAINLRDVSPPMVTWDQGIGLNGAGNPIIEFNMDAGVCEGSMPDLSSLVLSSSDNCGEPVVITQSTPIGSTVGAPLTLDANGCPYAAQLFETIMVTDCFGLQTQQIYEIRFIDNQAPQFDADPCVQAQASVNFPATPIVADGTCMITIPDLTDMITAPDNCPVPPGSLTIVQDPAAGSMVDVSNMCPADNFIDVTFTPMDCNGNMGNPVTCTDLLEFTDNTIPTVVCPADPITVVVPFDGITCEIGMVMVDIALLIAEGVTVEDNCDDNAFISDVAENMFTCSDIGKAGLFVTITGEDCFMNSSVPTNCDIEVVADSDLVADWSIGGGDFIVCPDEFPISIVLGADTPGCGVWSGDVNVTGVDPGPYTLVAADFPDLDADGNPDPGAYSITYTVGPVGCHAEITHNIMVSPEFDADDAALIADFSICWEMGETFDLEGLLDAGSIQGGAYSIVLGGAATGTQIGNLFQYDGGDGTLTVTYTLEDCDADVETDEVVITIDEKTDGHFTMAADMCQDEGVETPNITGVPAGASVAFASSPVGFITNAATGEFDPAAGPLAAEFVDVTVTMTVSNGVCDDFTISQIVRVYESGDPAFTIPATICESDAPLDLLLDNPLNDGGVNPLTDPNVTWTGTSVGDLGATGTFDPSVGPGVYTICVTVGAPSCEEEQCHDITVEPDYVDADVALIDDFDFCATADETIIDFAGLLDATAVPGGEFAVVEAGSLVGTINPNSYHYEEGCGTLTITYSFPDDCDVPTEDVVVITIEQKPDVGGLALPGPMCATDDEVFIDYSGSPEICGTFGEFTGAGITDLGTGTTALFSPADAGESADFSEHEITYTLASPTGICNDVVVVGIIQVDASSPTDFTVPGEVCVDEVVDLVLDNADDSVLPASPDGNTEIEWFGGDGVNAIVTDNGDGTGTFVGTVNGTYTVCVRTGDPNCSQMECQQITVDITPPVLDCVDLVRTRDNAAGVCSYDAIGAEFDVTATDNCAPPNAAPVLTHDYPPYVGTDANSLAGATFPVGITDVIWTATDEAGNSSNCTVQIVIVDAEDATVQSCPANIAQGTDADVCGAEISYVIPQFADNCDGIDLEGVLVSGYAPGADFPVGVTTVTWEYTDLADNATATCTFTVTVTDDDNPTPICSPAYAVSLDGDGEFNVIAADIDNASYDNCDIVSALISRDGDPFAGSVTMTCADVNSGPITVTLQVTDAAGNMATCTTDITVNDDQTPDIECTGNLTVGADPDICGALVTYLPPTVTDNCSNTVTQLTTYGGLVNGTQEVPANATTGGGTVSAVLDNNNVLNLTVWYAGLSGPATAAHLHNAPAGSNGGVEVDLGALGFPIGESNGLFNTTVALTAGQAADFLAGNFYLNIHTAMLPGGEIRGQLNNQGLTSGDEFPVGSTIIGYQVEDLAGNIESCTFTILVIDEVSPTIDCGDPTRVHNVEPGTCEYTFPDNSEDPLAMDNCQVGLDMSHNYPSGVAPNTLAGSTFPGGITTVTWIATDAAGNTSGICAIDIIIVDNIDPTVQSCPTSFAQGTDADACGAEVTYDIPLFADNCDGTDLEGLLVNGYAPGTEFPIGVTTVTWTYSDVAGNGPATCTFDVTINDDDDPTPVCQTDIDVVLDGDGAYVLLADDVDLASFDNCEIVSTLISRDGDPFEATAFFSCDDIDPGTGTVEVTLQVIDAAGNDAECTTNVAVLDLQVPDIECPGNFTVLNDAGVCEAVVTYAITVTDNCSTTLTQTDGTGLTSGDAFPVGTTVQTWEVEDIAGNTESCSFEITVLDEEPPTVDCAPLVRSNDNDAGVCSFTMPGAGYDVTANDNCPNWTLTHDYGPAPSNITLAAATFPVGITDVIWTATDASGNHTSCTVQIQISDTEDATVQSCPANDAQGTDADICGANYTYTVPQFADNCDGVDLEGVLVSGYAPGTDFPVGVTTVTWEYTDLADNATATCTFTVTISDDDNPTPICSPAYAVSLDGDGEFDVLATDIDNASYDNCEVVSALISRDGNPFAGSVTMTCADVLASPITVTLQVTDAAGNVATCTTDVTVNDDQTPDIECPGSYTVVADPVTCSAVVTYPAPTVTDNCSYVVTQTDGTGLTSGDAFPVGTTVQTYEVEDIAGNTESCSFSITVIDEVAPTIDCGPSVRTESADPGVCSFTMPGAGFDAVGADNCPGVVISHNYPYAVDPNTLAGTTFPVGSTTVTWIATDVYGNQSDICGIEIVITDDEDPTIDCGAGTGAPANILMNGSFEANAGFDTYCADNFSCFGGAFVIDETISPAFPSAQDGTDYIKTFGGAGGLFQDFPATEGDELTGSAYLMNASFDPTNPAQFGVVKFEFFNAGNGLISFIEGPMLFAADLPTDVWIESSVAAIAPPGTVTARFVVVSVSPAGGAVMFDAASVTVGSGGTSGDVSVSNDDGECGADLDINNPMADDNCGIVSIINNYNYTQNASGFYPVGTTVVGFTATDASGNTAECTITVEVTDDEEPEFVNCPTEMVMVGNDVDECSGKLNWSIPVATDNCELESITQTAGPTPGTPVPVGTAMDVTYTAVDIYGNSSECTFSVQVIDTQEPAFDADIVMPGDITVECDDVPTNCVFHGAGDVCEPLDNDDVNDNCTASADLVIAFDEVSTQDPDPNVCGHYNYTLTRTWTVTDEAGNVLTHVQVVTVQDTTPPVPACQDATIALDKFGMASINPVDLIAGTTDNCAPFSALSVVASQTDFDCGDLGANSVTFTISDPCGNSATCTITVTVEEGPAPCTPGAEVATSCLNNATTLLNGQFEELITVTSLAMEDWTVTSSVGLYTSTSSAPPVAPTSVAAGAAFTAGNADGIDNDGDGQIDEADEMIYYTFLARFVEGEGYDATVSNGTTSIDLSNIAYYPTPAILDLDDQICLNAAPFTPGVEDQYAGAGAYVSVQYFVNGEPVTEIDPAALGYGQHLLTVIVDANGFTPSTYIDGVNLPGTAATDAESRLDPGCEQEYSEFFLIVETPTQVVCNSQIHVTLEEDCESVITPDMVLEGTYPCFDDYSVVITLPSGVPLSPPDVVNGSHAGMNLPYSLVHPTSGNVCWGYILVEDKTDPQALCPGDVEILCTVDPDSIVVGLPLNHPCYPATDYWGNTVQFGSTALYLGEPDAIDCSSWTWEYTDDYVTFDCTVDPALIAVITRTFVVSDEFGNVGTCTQTINKVRGEVDNVNLPPDLVFACNDPILNSIAPGFHPGVLDNLFDWECGGNTQGWPEIWDTDLTTSGTGVCGLGITYTDELVNICPNSYKVVRTWKIHDWCPAAGGAPTITTHIQYIKVENVAPSITVECDFYEAGTGYCVLNATEPGVGNGLCYAIYVPFAQVDAVCDEIVEVTVETSAGFTTNGGYLPAPGLPVGGPYDIVYRAEDQCGNISEYVLTVVVEDKTAPIAVCDEITDVNLTANGQAVVFAETFDDGSYDNCCMDEFQVRRMVDNCGIPSDLTYGPDVTFCCADIADSPIMVEFRAVDCNGNANTCMVEVNVQDKIFPIAVSCPPNERVTCDWFADNLETQLANAADQEAQCDILSTYFGTAEFFDNCGPIIECNVNINVDQCLEGVVTRNYTVSDASGNTLSNQCNQIIFVDHVSDWVVEFPADITVTCGNTVPDFGEPEIFFETCELVAVSSDDEVFTTVPDACYKILRTWTVINWCVVGDEIDEEVAEDPENQLGLPFPACDLDGDGDCDNRTFRDSWRSGTPANLRRPTAADATSTTDPDTDFDSDPWDGYITYQQTIKVIDNVDPVFTNGCEIPDVCIEDNTCVAVVNLPTPDVDECSTDISITATGGLGSGFGPHFNVAPGTYDVTYTAMDNCNNQTACETTITVVDCKKPTPYCKNGIIVELMVVDPAMVEVWASDLDAGSFDNCPGTLKLSFTDNVDDDNIVFTCDDVGQNTVTLWVTDAAGNQDFCETFVIIQANMISV